MGQLLIVILILAAVFGSYRCRGTLEDGGGNAPDRLEETLQTPQQVEQAMQQQVDQITQRNRDMLHRY